MSISDTTFEALAEPTRRRLLDAIRDEELSVGELVDVVRQSQPSVSRHLRILREAGLVTVRLDAQRRLYRAEPEALRGIEQWLAPYRRHWTAQLDSLAQHLAVAAPSIQKKDPR